MGAIQIAIVGSLLLALGYLTALTLTAVVAAVRAGGRREEGPESADALAASRLTIPVSLIVPAGDATDIRATIQGLLDLSYPEFEVIVVVDKPATAVSTIEDEWALESVEFFYRRALETSAVWRIFRSGRDPRLMVIEKEPGHPSDSWNVGVNVARYRFVATVPLGITFDREALLRAMAPALDDPRTVVGVFSPVERRRGAESQGWTARFERLRALRASMVARLFQGGVSRQVDAGGVRLWRRDSVLNAGGFSATSVRPDLDLAFKVVRESDCRVVCASEPFGTLSVDDTSARQTHEDARDRQRAALRVVQDLKWQALGSAARTRVGAFLEAELVTPAAQAWVITAAVSGAMFGVLSWSAALACLVLLSFGTAIVSVAAVLLAGSNRLAPDAAEARALLWASPFEVTVFRPRLAKARMSAVFRPSQRR